MDWFPEFLTINVVGFLLTFATGFIVTVVVLMRHLDRLRVWIFGIVAHLLAFGVLLLQPSLPLPLFVLLFNGLQIFALCAYIATTLFLLGGDIRRPLFIAIQAVIVGFAVILSFITPDRWIRVVLMSVAFAGLLVYGVILILKGARAAKIRNGPIILISMFVIGSFLYLLRAFVYLLPPHPWGLGDIETESLMTLAGIVLYTSINYALLVILMARVERELTGKVIELGDSRNTLQILYDAFSETAGSVDLDELLPRILDILQRNLHVDVTIIYIKDGKSDDLQLVAQRGLSAEALDAVIHHERGSILSEQASLQGTTAHRRIEEYPEGRLKDALKGLGLASFAAFPIIDRGQSLGSLGVAFKDETALDEARSSLFETMARQLGSIVRAAMLHAELERANARLDILASTDALTHLPNRRTALRVLEREISRAKRLGSKISVIMCDIDHFKLFNDRHGHDCGDYVLVQTATLIADSLRSTDLASRWGGEEFLLILGNADPEGVVGLAERIRKRVQAAVMEYEGLRLSVTITLGVAINSPDLGGDAVIAKADEALYEGKRLGRNRVGVAVDRDLSSLEIGKGFRSPQGEEEPLDLLPGED